MAEVVGIANGAFNARVAARVRDVAARVSADVVAGSSMSPRERIRAAAAGMARETAAAIPADVSFAARRVWEDRRRNIETANARFQSELKASIRRAATEVADARARLADVRKEADVSESSASRERHKGENTLNRLEELSKEAARFGEALGTPSIPSAASALHNALEPGAVDRNGNFHKDVPRDPLVGPWGRQYGPNRLDGLRPGGSERTAEKRYEPFKVRDPYRPAEAPRPRPRLVP